MDAPFATKAEAQRHYADVSARLRGAAPAPAVARRLVAPEAAPEATPVATAADPYAAIGRLLVSLILSVADDGRIQPHDVLRALGHFAPGLESGAETRIPVLLVLEVAAEIYRCPVQELRLTGKRARATSNARRMAMAAAVRLTRRSRHEISRTFDCDHSTITSAHNRVSALILERKTAAAELAHLEARILARHQEQNR
ncbi:helix-turn-helix domain-containing protein [Aquabacter cavernae]|uniref:helix-turn-helix domain-containing protein n=1 Tax=Aquabacter cavernae TaxID=2496029 RepID=UPI000F8C47A4|nr:helix-turn-helix domain-containing protein [Aquabacter cavernae]